MNSELIERALRESLAAIDPMLWASTSPDYITLANGVRIGRTRVQNTRNLIEMLLIEEFGMDYE